MLLKANLNKSVTMIVLLLAMTSTTSAVLLFPIHVGKKYEYHAYRYSNPTNEWTVWIEFVEKMTVDSLDYYRIQVTNYNNEGEIEYRGYARSTEREVYGYNPDGDDYLQFQRAGVRTRWDIYQPMGVWDYLVTQIVDIERVYVPWRPLRNAYKHRKYWCNYPDDYPANRSSDYLYWVVPGVGVAKEIDDWRPGFPGSGLVMELVNVSSPLEDAMAATLDFFDESVANGTLVGVGKGKGKRQLRALRKMLETAAELIEGGYNREACEQLSDAYERCDGWPFPPDYVTRDSTKELAAMIQEIISGLECD
jgi:hypothetical protein